MGYITEFYGDIQLKSKRAKRVINNLILKKEKPFDCFDDIELKKSRLSFNTSWKNYEGEMEDFCLFIAKLDKKASGEIECEGEEKEDLWRIKIEKGEVFISIGVVNYEERGNHKKIEPLKEAYKYTKDEELRDEIMLAELGDKNGKES